MPLRAKLIAATAVAVLIVGALAILSMRQYREATLAEQRLELEQQLEASQVLSEELAETNTNLREITAAAEEARAAAERAAASLRVSEQRYRFLADTIPVQVWTAAPDGRLDFVSQRVADLLQKVTRGDARRWMALRSAPGRRRVCARAVEECARERGAVRDRVPTPNLGGNAIKFIPRGGSVVMHSGMDGDEIRFSVVDSGDGIAPEELAHVFDRYWQGRDRARLGAGLGLWIAKGIVDAHGGRIEVESAKGLGTTVWVTLPTAGSTQLLSPPS